MIKRLIIGILVSFSAVAASDSTIPYVYLKAPIDVTDYASLQRGARLYMNMCVGCHSLKYVRYDSLAKGIGITDESGAVLDKVVQANLMFVGNKLSDAVDVSMTTVEGANWFGVAPPDLTLEARYRGADWLYNYFRTFYVDSSRPWGVNNLVFPDVAMPNVFLNLQGEQIATPDGLKLVRQGSMTPAEFDQAAADLVNFMVYVAEPAQVVRRKMGVWLLIFGGIFAVFAYLLKREYWKDVK